MNKETLDILNDLSKRKTTDLALSIMELTADNLCKDKEIDRLNNIINEFDEWLLGEKMMFYRGSDDERLIRYYETKNKWLELKGGK